MPTKFRLPVPGAVTHAVVWTLLILCTVLLHCEHTRPTAPRIGTEVGSFVFFETPIITHTQDYYPYNLFIPDSTPHDWYYPVNYVDGMWRFTVTVLSMKDSTALPIYYTCTWSGGVAGTPGFLRASVLVDKGRGTYESYAAVRDIEWSPDGSCCQTIGNKYWPWENAWAGVGGDLVAMAGGDRTFPVTVKAKLTFYSKGYP